MTDSVRGRFLAPLDILLLAGLVLAGGWSTWRLFSAPRGARAVVWVDGRRVAWHSLDGPVARDSIPGALGAVYLEHGEGAIRIASAPCPGKLCMRQGRVHRAGEKLVCVPSRVVVALEGDAPAGETLDAVH
jgi:hypothetical protein